MEFIYPIAYVLLWWTTKKIDKHLMTVNAYMLPKDKEYLIVLNELNKSYQMAHDQRKRADYSNINSISDLDEPVLHQFKLFSE